MKKYRILAACLTGLKGNQLKSGTVHAATEFIVDHIDELVAQGFIEEVTDEQLATEAIKEEEKITESKMVDYVVTQTDLDNNPDLVAKNVQVGETIQIPSPAKKKK